MGLPERLFHDGHQLPRIRVPGKAFCAGASRLQATLELLRLAGSKLEDRPHESEGAAGGEIPASRPEQLDRGWDGGRDDRRACGHRFHDGESEGLGERWAHNDVGVTVQPFDVLGGLDEQDMGPDLEFLTQADEPLDVPLEPGG